MAKGLPGSRSNPHMLALEEAAPKYVYFYLLVQDIKDHSLDAVKALLDDAHEDFDGIDTFCSERHGVWDVANWCEDRDIDFEPIFPTYDRQKEAFKEVLIAVREGRIKSPELGIIGVRESEDIMREEMALFNHDGDKKWFGSPEKGQRHGVQDDFMFASAWCMYGGRNKGIDDFRQRKTIVSFGEFSPDNSMIGSYK